MLSPTEIGALICLAWATFVVAVQIIGISATFRYFSRRPPPSVSSKLGPDAPAVTIIRPVKGLDPHLYNCIASTFRQDYPIDKVSIRLCVDSENDAAYPTLQKLVADFPAFDAQVLVESRDPGLHGPDARPMGPNPKVRNISRAYREAKGDIVWIIDCNVWVAKGVLGRMVDKLVGYGSGETRVKPYKFVHQMPLVVDMFRFPQPLPSSSSASHSSPSGAAPEADEAVDATDSMLTDICRNGGGRLDEMFMATTHAKFYGAINSVGIAPCIVGKSNMFRKSHLDRVTAPAHNPATRKDGREATGVDYFSYNICEDHLIGDLLWRSKIPGYLNHGLVWGDLVVQPMAGMSVSAYTARRVRWLRARKFTVLAATLVEPGVESLLCCGYLAFALTSLPYFNDKMGIPQTWSAMGIAWAVAVLTWMAMDWLVFRRIHSGQTVDVNEDTPPFARGSSHSGGQQERTFREWALAWAGRECMALPIWTWAVLLGTTISWRGKTFRVRMDTSVVDMTQETRNTRDESFAKKARKDRVE
ncbi:ceramide glucosyltransferase [Drechmeria coniospora]|uniref:Ceramide glucosyltransferase n=1 Tax=Drechmeria coniospora TaxID=98403 RepID=A0A151GX55_DRECN|nr:ceramide glucosyltransferase [Drechmeria coniospora]KYK61687.1 ceramide glucosyltransferase [Drechmeria coniospora]ODA82485.1 hypothetical protein RJ55_00992 [Drechmeria coniospora]